MRYDFDPLDIVGFYDPCHEHLVDCLIEYVLNLSKMGVFNRLDPYMPQDRTVLKREVLQSLLIQELVRESLHI